MQYNKGTQIESDPLDRGGQTCTQKDANKQFKFSKAEAKF